MNPRGLRDLDAHGNLHKHPRANPRFHRITYIYTVIQLHYIPSCEELVFRGDGSALSDNFPDDTTAGG